MMIGFQASSNSLWTESVDFGGACVRSEAPSSIRLNLELGRFRIIKSRCFLALPSLIAHVALMQIRECYPPDMIRFM